MWLQDPKFQVTWKNAPSAQHGQSQSKRTQRMCGGSGARGWGTGQRTHAPTISFFSIQPRSSKVCTDRKTIMYLPHANTYPFLCPDTQ